MRDFEDRLMYALIIAGIIACAGVGFLFFALGVQVLRGNLV